MADVPDLVSDIQARMMALATDRLSWERIWMDIAIYAIPNYARFMAGLASNPQDYSRIAMEPSSVERGRNRFDDTAVRAVDRLGAGMESLVTPQNDKWHGLATLNPLGPEETDEEKEYYERYRDYIFKVRYHPRSGFIGAHQKAIRSAIAMGTGIVFVEENNGSDQNQVPVFYRYIPLSECYIAVDARGEPDTLYRKFSMTARQMVQQFGEDNVSQQVKDRASQKLTGRDDKFNIVHAVQPRREKPGYGAKGAPWASVYIDADNSTVLNESGFYEFPYIVYSWEPVEDQQPYAQSPVMMCLSEIKGVNAMVKVGHRGMQLYMDPPVLTGPEGLYNRMNFNPGKVNPGMLMNGTEQAKFMQPGARPDFITEVLKYSRDTINDSLYISLFQILAQASPSETATEAMIRANEKGELLGPAGGRIQTTMGREVERLSGILERKGAFRSGSPLAPPDSLKGKAFGARFTSPLDLLRRRREAIGIQQTLQTALPLMQVDPSVADNFDFDTIVRTLGESNGVPQDIFKTSDERDAARQQRQQMQQLRAGLEMAKTGGEAAKNIVPAVGQAAAVLGNGQVGAPAQ